MLDMVVGHQTGRGCPEPVCSIDVVNTAEACVKRLTLELGQVRALIGSGIVGVNLSVISQSIVEEHTIKGHSYGLVHLVGTDTDVKHDPTLDFLTREAGPVAYHICVCLVILANIHSRIVGCAHVRVPLDREVYILLSDVSHICVEAPAWEPIALHIDGDSVVVIVVACYAELPRPVTVLPIRAVT